jgi:hypothetical protein
MEGERAKVSDEQTMRCARGGPHPLAQARTLSRKRERV